MWLVTVTRQQQIWCFIRASSLGLTFLKYQCYHVMKLSLDFLMKDHKKKKPNIKLLPQKNRCQDGVRCARYLLGRKIRRKWWARQVVQVWRRGARKGCRICCMRLLCFEESQSRSFPSHKNRSAFLCLPCSLLGLWEGWPPHWQSSGHRTRSSICGSITLPQARDLSGLFSWSP